MVKLKMYKTKIPSDISTVCPTINEIFSYIRDTFGVVSENAAFETKVILNELIINAIRHGNKEDRYKSVKIRVAITREKKLLVIIEDEGEGYNTDSLFINDTCSLENLNICDMKVSGRGLIIVKNLCDEIRSNKKGNRIIILKKLFPV